MEITDSIYDYICAHMFLHKNTNISVHVYFIFDSINVYVWTQELRQSTIDF